MKLSRLYYCVSSLVVVFGLCATTSLNGASQILQRPAPCCDEAHNAADAARALADNAQNLAAAATSAVVSSPVKAYSAVTIPAPVPCPMPVQMPVYSPVAETSASTVPVAPAPVPPPVPVPVQESANLAATTSAQRVPVELFYETLCPTSQYFLRNQLRTLFSDKEVAGKVDLRLYPFGNGMASWSGSAYNFQCQHGELECLGNKLHVCALQLLREPDLYVPFFSCMADYFQYDINDAARTCAEQQNIDLPRLNSCASAQELDPIMFSIFQKSNQLEPPRKYVPWVVVNGAHSERSEQGYIIDEVCQVLKAAGVSLPSTCTGSSGGQSFMRRAQPLLAAGDLGPPPPCYGPGPNGTVDVLQRQ